MASELPAEYLDPHTPPDVIVTDVAPPPITDATLGVAFDIRAPRRKRSGAATLGGGECFLDAVDGLVGVAGVTRYADRTDRRRHRHRGVG